MTAAKIDAYRVPAPNCVRVDVTAPDVSESWGFVVGERRNLLLVDYTVRRLNGDGEWGPPKHWDGMASQNGPRSYERIDQPDTVPEDVVIHAWRVVGFPVSPGVAST